ncbi:MAG: hydroxymethylglutaryl-CoA reductase, degradative [Bdellovibrionales bacterium CG10_big_fil_rev_8_21_14_0_10_45_34]|nr:MAG: hydroxymethylglutaryl-CoA reductase, degradative [Bdellovibrionales bacterium CG10_big_fil_rev_8_21_14_0_10_45_34]
MSSDELTNYEQMCSGFSKLPRSERLSRLKKLGLLTTRDVEFLELGESLPKALSEHFIENTIGCFSLPLGVAMNFRIDGRDYAVPMAVEETSIIAAASKTAKWIRSCGEISTEVVGKEIIGQIQIAKPKNVEGSLAQIEQQRERWLKLLNEKNASLVMRGGGFTRIESRTLDRNDGAKMLVIHVYCDPCDAMGANIMNQACESLKKHVEQATSEKVTMCILSNLVDSKVTRAKVVLRDLEESLVDGIVEAGLFAEVDPYRAATHNKGIMNGIDAVLIATGNDWRAVSAGLHSYAARSGQYRALTKWRKEGESLIGEFEGPLVVGTVGGMTALHPTAQLVIRMLGVESAEQLSRICAAVGLVQNLGALRALSTVGVVEGHMKLHAANLAVAAGASEAEMPLIQRVLEEILVKEKRVSLTQAKDALKNLRSEAVGFRKVMVPSEGPA